MKKIKYIIFIFLIGSFAAFSQERIKLLTYNILNYPNFASTKNAKYQLIFNEAKPDIVAVQEILSQYGVNLFLSDVLGNSFSAAPFFDGPDTDNALFYKDSIFTLLSAEIIPNSPRYITRYLLEHKFTLDRLIIYIAHFKAGNTPSDEYTREQEAARVRIYTNQHPAGTNFILVGDFNLYHSTEAAYVRLLDQVDTGYFLDPIDRPGYWHENSSFSDVHTQSTRTFQLNDGGSTGGLDDRFDFILVSQSIMSLGGIDYVQGSYWAYGNDGLHFNQQLVNPPYPISEQIAFALHDVSDHLPVVAEFAFGVVNDVEQSDQSLFSYHLYQNYPNPFNPVTTIKFEVPVSQQVELSVFDVLGRAVKVLFNDLAPAGIVAIDFNAEELSSGVYFYRIKAQNFMASKKLVIIR
jgi:endonuclease/exonuclease/phosphatase family metal-dependent hydrolase